MINYTLVCVGVIAAQVMHFTTRATHMSITCRAHMSISMLTHRLLRHCRCRRRRRRRLGGHRCRSLGMHTVPMPRGGRHRCRRWHVSIGDCCCSQRHVWTKSASRVFMCVDSSFSCMHVCVHVWTLASCNKPEHRHVNIFAHTEYDL